jgi:hypothetical protein
MRVPFPLFPDLPDDDPIRSLKMFRGYVREVTNYVRPYQLLVTSIATPLLAFAVACLLLGFETALSWASDLVPLTFAVISVLVSVKKLRDQHQTVVVAFVLVLGFLGSFVMHFSRTNTESAHHVEIGELKNKMDSVGQQNGLLLKAFLEKPTLSSQEAEMERRKNIQKALRSEYILSHENVSEGLLAGTELPPADWMNKRLHELGEKWTVSPPPANRPPVSTPVSQPPPEGEVAVVLAIGDDNAVNPSMKLYPSKIGMAVPSFECAAPFICYTEDQLKTTRVTLNFKAKKYRRLFFVVGNSSAALISRATVKINISPLDDTVKGISLYRPGQARDSQQHVEVQFHENETTEIVPYSRTSTGNDFAVDLEVEEGSRQNFVVLFGVFAANLTLHVVSVDVHVVWN